MTKKFTCLECGENGCVLVVDSIARTPKLCPFGLSADKVRWTREE